MCIQKFPNLLNKWKLFKGGIAVNYIEKIGLKIDLAMIDSSHFEPGEILDFLMILPFLKEEAIIIFHDIDHQITSSYGKDMRNEWAPYIIFNLIRGEKYLPSGKGILNKDIGAIKLEKNQKRFIHDYCRALGGQWQYFPSEKNIKDIIKYFEKYYDKDCQTILKESIEFNRQFLKDNPKEDFYGKKRHKNLFYFNNTFKGQYISNNSFSVSSYNNTTRENKEEIDIQNYINLAFNNILLEKNNTFNCSDNPKISIVISVFNGEAYLNTALRSIQNQDLKDIEIIMVDDYSSDNSLNMINNLMINEPRIKLYKNEKNRGALYTKTKGALLAKGKYILILDEDDMYLQRDAFTVLYNEAEKNNLDLIKFGMIISKPLIEKKNYINYINKEEIIFQPKLSSLMFRYNEKGDVKIVQGLLNNILIKRNILIEVIEQINEKYFNEKMNFHDDFLIFFLLIRKAHNLKKLNRIFTIKLLGWNTTNKKIKYREKEKRKIYVYMRCNSLLTFSEFILNYTENTFYDKKIAFYSFNKWFLNHFCRNYTKVRDKAINISKLYLKNKYINKIDKNKINSFLDEAKNDQINHLNHSFI